MSEGKAKPHIVLIEDNPGDVFLIMRALASEHIDCVMTRFNDGEDALSGLKSSAGSGGMVVPDLILLDLNLPRVDGRQVLTAVRQNAALAQVPIAVVTSSFSPRDRDDALTLGADRYVQKPTHLQDFLQTIGSAVRELLDAPARG